MYELILKASDCISCGTCMDVCPPGAIDMHRTRKAGVEQRLASGTGAGYMTFPYLSLPDLCDGCLVCIRQCPTVALTLRPEGQAGPHRARSTECSVF